jgi:uncharacterized phage-associated protein
MKTKKALNFDYRKATQALNLFALKEGSKINKMKALKLIFFADRYHLRKYGRLITNDTYVAMSNGPVASGTRDIIEKTSYISSLQRDYANLYLTPSGYNVKSKSSPDEKVFSDSDIEALEFAWKKFGHLGQFELVKITHKYPEWIAHKEELKHNRSVQIDLADFLNDPDADVDKCFGLTDEDKELRRKHLEEMDYVESIWR